jgi:hypothetical protein
MCSVTPAYQMKPWTGESGLLCSLLGPLFLDRFPLLLLVVRLWDLARHIVLLDLASSSAAAEQQRVQPA